ncbi:ABC transporter ATP-binding protein [Dactylosporangium sp. AC04546]|uniref:ABC transporter ATP-binding protein n=1 Tax=Dactylosporangium sp. AC04546 TaxID=2862460 RepID=UPI001EE0659D|nr:ABC transporter ATP-binding protein [Dactylosporangium sp. AC04546]WVK80677.1 ABC transporter ATP-binding protein [Dactylosporangium sp. AC04546]
MNADGADHASPALKVERLSVAYRVRGVDRPALREVDFTIGQGESFGLVGESGCGKSTAALAINRYLPRNGRIVAGRILVDGRDMLDLGSRDLRQLRRQSISMVYQEPGKALNPSLRVGRQVAEAFELLGASSSEAYDRAESALKKVHIADPGRVMRAYPHQLSGGMLQRIVIAMAISVDPALLILDEPTTALDATVEAEVLDLIAGLREELGTATLLISHNLAVVSKMCDRVGVMYAGEMVEQGSVDQVFDNPRHPYTVGLLRCVPRRGQRKDLHRLDTIPGFLPRAGDVDAGCVYAPRCGLSDARCRTQMPPLLSLEAGHASRCFNHASAGELPWTTAELVTNAVTGSSEPVISVRGASKTYRGRHGERIHALVDVDLDVFAGETLGIVGESGCGKSTLARLLVGLEPADPGSVVEVAGRQVGAKAGDRTPEEKRLLQIVFQNPDSALNRRHKVRHIISRSLSKLARLEGAELDGRLAEVVGSVRMEDRHLSMRPSQLSGGLKQRVAIARAFAGSPRVLVCDEPTSALDVSVQAAILNLLVDLQAKEGMTYVFISHDLGVVRYVSDRIVVLYLGRVMEHGTAEDVFGGPHHPYTEALLSAASAMDGNDVDRIRLTGEIPNPADPPSGCVFQTRCHRKLADGTCERVEPELREILPGKFVRCHLPVEQLATPGPRPEGAAASG